MRNRLCASNNCRRQAVEIISRVRGKWLAAPLPHLGAGRSGKHDGRRKLLEAKENAVRAVLFEADGLAVIWFMLRNGNDRKSTTPSSPCARRESANRCAQVERAP